MVRSAFVGTIATFVMLGAGCTEVDAASQANSGGALGGNSTRRSGGGRDGDTDDASGNRPSDKGTGGASGRGGAGHARDQSGGASGRGSADHAGDQSGGAVAAATGGAAGNTKHVDGELGPGGGSARRDAGVTDGGAGRSGGGGRAGNGGSVVNDAGSSAGASGKAGVGTCPPPVPGSKGTNPLFTDKYTADPAPLVHDCTFYVHCGHDEGSTSFVMKEWFVLSSTDMVHWTKKVAMSLSTFSWAKANAWAGQVVAKGGKFYWYVPVAEGYNGAMAIGVAVSDSPTGPFVDAIGKPLVNDAFEMSNMEFSTPEQTPFTIDPTVLVDDDGQAYLHYGGFSRMVQVKLDSDMVSVSGKMQESTPQGYFEAPYLLKRNGIYYEIYAAGTNPATIDYATANSPMGPWTRRGRILDAFPKSSTDTDWPTNHAGVAEFAGNWYIVYHTSNGPNGGGTYKREVAIDQLTFNPDGTLGKVTPSVGLSF